MNTMIKSSLLNIVFILVTASMLAQGRVDRSKPPQAAPAPALQIGKYEMATLDNGLKVIVVENRKLPRISWSIRLDIDPVVEGPKAGYVDMAGDLLTSGTANRTKSELDERIDFLGASLSSSRTGLFASSLTKHTDDLLTLMQDVLLNPSFPESEIEKLRKQNISGLASQRTSPDAISERIGNLLKYGAKHPYGEFATEKSLNAITRSDLVGYYQTFFRPNVAYLVVVGDIGFQDAVSKAQHYFGEWDPAPVPKANYPTPVIPKGNTVAFVPLPGAVQSLIDVSYALELRPGTQEAIEASVLSSILGGNGFQSRLMQNLREDKAYTYGAYASISPDEIIGAFSAECNVRNEVTDSSIAEILFEMRQLVDQEVDEEMLQTIKNILTGNFARSLERPQTVANFAVNIQKYNLPADYYETYLQKLNAVTVQDVQRIARKMLRPDNAYITVVGNREIIPTLGKFSASGKVEMYQPDGLPLLDLREVPQGMTAEKVFDAYIRALGGEKAIKKVKGYEVKGKMDMGVMVLELNQKVITGSPGKSVMTVNMMGMEAMKQVFDGTQLAQYQMGQRMPSTEGDATDALISTDLLAEINYTKYGIRYELKGIDAIEGKDYYVIELKLPGGSINTDYFDVATGLRYRTIEASEQDGTTSIAEKTITEYMKSKANVLFPKVVQINADGQTFAMETNELLINPKLVSGDFVIK